MAIKNGTKSEPEAVATGPEFENTEASKVSGIPVATAPGSVFAIPKVH